MTHADLVQVAARWLRRSAACRVVLTEKPSGGGEIPDAIGWDAHRRSTLVEVKVSRGDFFRDRKKPSRDPRACMGRLRWYLTPRGLLQPEEIPEPWGLLEWTGARVWRRKAAVDTTRSEPALRREIGLLVAELNAYQAQGITYARMPATLGESLSEAFQRELDVREAQVLMGLRSRRTWEGDGAARL